MTRMSGQWQWAARRLTRSAMALPIAALAAFTCGSANAQLAPTPPPGPAGTFPQRAAQVATLNLGSTYLGRLIAESHAGYAQRMNPGGGGAPSASAPLRYRNWFELYGQAAKTDAQNDYVGDSRRTIGGIAGFGAAVAPGFNLGLSVDQSHSKINLPLALQRAKFDLTQLGINGSVERGSWMLAFAAVHGFGRIHSERFSVLGPTTASYDARMTGVLAELSYYWALGQARIVPKLAAEYVHAATDGFTETGPLALSVAKGTGERTRVVLGAEIGHYWIVEQKILDLSAYGKFVDNVSQNMSDIAYTNGVATFTAQGIRESRYGADAGATASLSLTRAARLYLTYDGKYRENFRQHTGTLGFEVKW